MNSVIPLFPGQGEESPRLEVALLLLDPQENESLGALLYGGGSPREYADRVITEYKAMYLDLLSRAEDAPELPSAIMNWTYQEIHGVRTYSHVQVIDRLKEYYTGGAHGMREKDYFVLDLTRQEQLRLRDLFPEESDGALKARLEDALRVYSGLESGAPLSTGYFFNDSVELPENFFLSPSGIGFHWDPYEIAPYAVGPVEVTIPYGDIRNLCTVRGKLLISRFD
jgi:hypothetical protein